MSGIVVYTSTNKGVLKPQRKHMQVASRTISVMQKRNGAASLHISCIKLGTEVSRE